MAAVIIETASITPLYKARARVQLDPEMPKVLPYQGITDSPSYYDDYYLQTKFEAFRTRTVARRVISRLNLPEDPAFLHSPSGGFFSERFPSLTRPLTWISSLVRSRATNPPKTSVAQTESDDAWLVNTLLGNLDVQMMKNSWLFEVSYTSYDPRFATKVVNTLTEEVIEENFKRKYEATMMATDFLQGQLRDLKIKVEKSEEELVNYGRQRNILNLSERQIIVMANLAKLNESMTKAQTELISKRARYESIKNASVENFPPSLKNELIASLETVLVQKERSLTRLSSQFGPEWPEVKQTSKEIQEIKAQLSREKTLLIAQEKNDFEVALHNNLRLQESLEQKKHQANRFREESIQYNILKREVETSLQLYEGLLQRLKEAGVSAGLKSSNIQVVDRAEVPSSPFYPSTEGNLATGLAFALISGLGLAFLLESLDNTIKTSEQVESFLGLPSLGLIPAMGPFLERTDRRALTDRQGQLKTAPVLLYKYLESRSQIWEAYRSLRTSILLSHSDKRPQKILVTSALVSEGKTTTAINTAVVMAQTGARTIMMDLDMRRPSLGRIFGINGKAGMSNFLSGNADMASQIRNTPFPNLYILPAGPSPPNPAELIGSKRMKGALALLEQYFEYIVIDSPPVLSVTDPLVVSRHVDGVIFVIHGGKTHRDALRKASESIVNVGGRILGAVINNVNIQSSEYSYYYRYYYHDHYYHQGKET